MNDRVSRISLAKSKFPPTESPILILGGPWFRFSTLRLAVLFVRCFQQYLGQFLGLKFESFDHHRCVNVSPNVMGGSIHVLQNRVSQPSFSDTLRKPLTTCTSWYSRATPLPPLSGISFFLEQIESEFHSRSACIWLCLVFYPRCSTVYSALIRTSQKTLNYKNSARASARTS